MRIRYFLIISFICVLNAMAQVNVFDTNVPAKHYYRIPAIIELNDGNLLAIGDDRHGSDFDIGGNFGIDIVGKYSTDGGTTWGNQFMIADGDGKREGFHDSHGDAAVVCDRETGHILIMCASGNQGFPSSSLKTPIRVGRYMSRDNGKTWSEKDVTDQIYSIFAGYPEVNGLFFSSGRICQSRLIKKGDYYRIYSAIDGPWGVGCLVLYSDDLGLTWHALGGPGARPALQPTGDEAKIEELPNGNVLLSCRSKFTETCGRVFNIYTYNDKNQATGSWAMWSVSNSPEDGTYTQDCACNGEILIVPVVRNSDRRPMHLALQSIPRGPGRQKVSIYFKALMDAEDYDSPVDFEWGWKCYQVTDNYSGYSTMIDTSDGNIAFFHEDCNDNNSKTEYDLLFQSLTIETITSGRYSVRS